MNDTLYGIARTIDRITVPVGRATALVLPILMLVIILNVVLRYGFGLGLVELEELQWHLNALIVLGCMAFAYRDDVHVRVDLFHAKFSPLRKAVVEFFGGLVLLMPFVIGIGWFAWGTFTYSLSIGEGSPMPSGLPARYVIKFCMFAGFALLGLQGIAQMCRALLTMRGAGSSYPPVSR
ncbi:TRAP transporter small permease subunit [Amorphus orientalis]|uniref:TRAP transporter small permease protein n=1 Tax=Amorphus orientalis TaxID=649198 RepID=A0AAE4ATZ8_9HYPH|nr:TRAP transporter small permease subunit [Amorphus orientalis]MDQ0315449.1 TRAP-type mannitol/chloroaromatic compound transport system permease small subunit [Amorphus orientalis]